MHFNQEEFSTHVCYFSNRINRFLAGAGNCFMKTTRRLIIYTFLTPSLIVMCDTIPSVTFLVSGEGFQTNVNIRSLDGIFQKTSLDDKPFWVLLFRTFHPSDTFLPFLFPPQLLVRLRRYVTLVFFPHPTRFCFRVVYFFEMLHVSVEYFLIFFFEVLLR